MRNIRHTARTDICRAQKHQHQRSIKHQVRKEAAVEGNQLSGSEMKDVGFHFPASVGHVNIYIYFFNSFVFGCRGSSLLLEDALWLWRVVGTLHYGAWASHSGGFSRCRL